MSTFDEAQERDMVLFVGSYLPMQKTALKKLEKTLDKKAIKACILIDVTDVHARESIAKDAQATVLECDFSSLSAIQRTLKPYKHRFLAVTCRSEKNIPLLRKTLPHVPYLNGPTAQSLDWTTDKIKMRELLRGFDKNISPKFLVVHDASDETRKQIEKKIGFPLIIKPAGLAASLLVSLCYHPEDLEKNLRNTVNKITKTYKKKRGRGEPQILVEEFMEGVMYSIDCYVNQRGVVYYTPLVHVKTGHSVGYEDFFGYERITPVGLRPHKIEAARKAAESAIEALNLRSTTCHIELMKTEDGWKIIEVGPRAGGFRHEMYELSYGMDHSLNDILIRIPKKPKLTKRVKGYTAILQFYAHSRGRLTRVEGVNKVRKLESFERIDMKKKPGQMCDFARNGDDPVFEIVLFNKLRPRLLADVHRLEQTVRIKVAQRKRSTKA